MQCLLVYAQGASNLPRRDLRTYHHIQSRWKKTYVIRLRRNHFFSSPIFSSHFLVVSPLVIRPSFANSGCRTKICCHLEDPLRTLMDHGDWDWQAPAIYNNNRSKVLFPHHTLVLRTEAVPSCHFKASLSHALTLACNSPRYGLSWLIYSVV